MVKEKIELKNKAFEVDYQIPGYKIDNAIEKCLLKIKRNIPRFLDFRPEVGYEENKMQKTRYIQKNFLDDKIGEWLSGMYEGMYWLCYEFTGDKVFLDAANHYLKYFVKREEKKHDMICHDTGFVFTPSLVAAYKVTGDKTAYNAALDAAQHFYKTNYCKKGRFILRAEDGKNGVDYLCRTMMDTMLNIPLLFWAGKESGNSKYTDAAIAQCETTEKYLIREDASSYHHYQFDTETFKPLHGLTFQGNSDNSTWSRGQSWGIMGYPIAYSYTGDKHYISLHRDITYYFLNHLQSDFLPNWDFDFSDDSDVRDSSAAAISVCGMLEMINHLPDDAPQKKVYKNASSRILESLIDNCSEYTEDFDGLICKVCSGFSNNQKDIFAVYGDYPYLEALMRYKNPDWKMYW